MYYGHSLDPLVVSRRHLGHRCDIVIQEDMAGDFGTNQGDKKGVIKTKTGCDGAVIV